MSACGRDNRAHSGGRARGTHRPSSDVDLAIKGKNLTIDTLAKLRYILEEETNLPYFFDIVNYDRVENEALKREIDECVGNLLERIKL